MKKDNVKLGSTYAVKVSGSVVPVRLDRENPHGGWDGTNVRTKKSVRIKSAQRLRGLWPKKTMPIVEEPITPEAAKAIHHADQENARLDEERRNSPDGRTASERAMATSAATSKKRRKANGKGVAETVAAVEKGNLAEGVTVPEAKKQRNSLLNLAAKALAEAGQPLSCKEMVERVLATGLWKSEGKTPSATLYSAILRECKTKGEAARFRKVERGKFEAATK